MLSTLCGQGHGCLPSRQCHSRSQPYFLAIIVRVPCTVISAAAGPVRRPAGGQVAQRGARPHPTARHVVVRGLEGLRAFRHRVARQDAQGDGGAPDLEAGGAQVPQAAAATPAHACARPPFLPGRGALGRQVEKVCSVAEQGSQAPTCGGQCWQRRANAAGVSQRGMTTRRRRCVQRTHAFFCHFSLEDTLVHDRRAL